MAKSKARTNSKWPEERELLDNCDGLAKAAGSESEHDRVTIYIVHLTIHAEANGTRSTPLAGYASRHILPGVSLHVRMI